MPNTKKATAQQDEKQPTAEEKFAAAFWKALSVADTNKDNQISSTEWNRSSNAIYEKYPGHAIDIVLNKILMNKTLSAAISGKTTGGGMDIFPITQKDCLVAGNLEIDKTANVMAGYKKECSRVYGLTPAQIKAGSERFKEQLGFIDSDNSGIITLGEIMQNNAGSFSLNPQFFHYQKGPSNMPNR